MKTKVFNLNNDLVGACSVSKEIFALTPRIDIIKRVIDWQRAKAMAGTHKVKTISEISGTTRKPFKQKGTGNARQGSLRSVHMRGGAVAHGPVTRSHATKLPKKIRKLGLRYALSSKLAEGRLFIIDDIKLNSHKTNNVKHILTSFKANKIFIITDRIMNDNFMMAIQNIKGISIVPQIGANVYDIINNDCVLLLRDSLSILEERLR